MDIRTGNGFDVHAFGPGDAVTLCGVAIPFEHALVGHSDADVGMHALVDAIFGALAEGDIGRWFPPSDPAWKGAASAVFLRKAVERAAARGFVVGNLDCTIVCEAPRIGPHVEAMRATLAGIAGIEADRISVKATTSERLGFTGRREGIAALATATLVKP
jgi:2-C-methyl-D-erythritol 2,4-cyclodiphosphate synthase